jgi:hypothetical protein
VQEAPVSDEGKIVVAQLRDIRDMTDEEFDAYVDELWQKLADGIKPGASRRCIADGDDAPTQA